jgi:hypothetical protein
MGTEKLEKPQEIRVSSANLLKNSRMILAFHLHMLSFVSLAQVLQVQVLENNRDLTNMFINKTGFMVRWRVEEKK